MTLQPPLPPSDELRAQWDAAAQDFDASPDHGLRDPQVRAAWLALLRSALPSRPGAALDLGCGTGSLSLLLAELGWQVEAIDFSTAMVALAREKAAADGQEARFQVMDAAHPVFPGQRFDLLLCRHLLWTLPQPGEVLKRWADLLIPGGLLLLIEGFWHTGAGLRAAQVLDLLPPGLGEVQHTDLSPRSALWGGPVSDERYLLAIHNSPSLDSRSPR